jgi:hypothetical protein
MTLPSSTRALSSALVGVLMASLSAAQAAEDAAKPISYKLTAGHYQLSGGGLPKAAGLDVNLRATGSFGNAWLGWYGSVSQDIRQVRAGWDSSYKLGLVRLTPSLQIASGGFVGGSLSVETGDTWFVGAGAGRTNLRNYANLNFDPNDAWMLSGGYRWADNQSLALQVVRDNRLNPDQQNTHLVYRTPFNGADRLTLDLLQKKGLVGGVPISRFGLSVGYDWPRYFVRVAWDPQVNFTAQDMLRLSAGVRF